MVLNLKDTYFLFGLPSWLTVKKSARNARDSGSIPGLGRSPGEGNGNSLQGSCLGNPVDRGACGLQSVGSQRGRCDSVTRRRQRCFEVIDRSVKIHDWSQYVSSLGKK